METAREFFQHRRRVIAERLAERCAEMDPPVSQYRLARMLDVSDHMVWDWFHAVHAPSSRYLRELEKVLDVPRGYFTTEIEDGEAA